MARRAKPPEPEPANLSADQIKVGIRKLEKRIGELRAVDFSDFDPDDPKNDTLESRIELSLIEVFGSGTIEHNQFQIVGLREYGTLSLSPMGGGPSRSEIIEQYRKGFNSAISDLEGAVEYLQEKLDDMGFSPGGNAVRAIELLDLHPAISKAASQKFKDGHYADAIETACKVLTNLVQNASNTFDVDGDDLMRQTFSPKKPVLSFNDLADKSDTSEQRGMMELYAGTIGAFRNPRAHKLVDDEPEFALEVIGFICSNSDSI